MASTTSGRSKAAATGQPAETQDQETVGQGAQEPLREAAGEIADQATRTIDAQASPAMTQVGDALDQVAHAARDAASSLRQERPEVAGVVDTAATKAEDAARYLREHNAREVVAAAEDVARRQPGVVIAGALAVGFVAARFLRSAGGTGAQSSSRMIGSSRGGDWYDAGTTSSGSVASAGTRPYSMGLTTAGRTPSGGGNGSGSQESYRLAEFGE